jgi:hypothetical protein
VVRLRKEEKLSWSQIARTLNVSSGSARRAYLAALNQPEALDNAANVTGPV